mmetsp:Transcript_3721/g.4166  ORF Transcript_3721/g.4166 Transcript_3721/m.4166 type:complete len:291 (-) Transcript_3721:853-1725(-)
MSSSNKASLESLEPHRIVIKLGGGLITNKQVLRKPRREEIRKLGIVVGSLQQLGFAVVLVHGAGSFGHILAKKWHLKDGRNSIVDTEQAKETSFEGVASQYEARDIVRNDMKALNGIIVEEFRGVGVELQTIPAHEVFTETGPDFQGDVSIFEKSPEEPIPITFGDVTNCAGRREFGILSGDDVVVRLSKELAGVKRLVFAVSGVDGILRKPPEEALDEDLITEFNPHSVSFVSKHDSEIDVTGGIGYKATCGYLVAKAGIPVVLVRGEVSSRVLAACKGEHVRGTVIKA